MNIVNLTRHVVTILDADKNPILVIPPSGMEARLLEKQADAGTIECDNGNIPLYRKSFTPQGLPPRADNTLYIVSHLVKSHNQGRTDLVCPGTIVTEEAVDRKGIIVDRIVGCIGLCF
jgi:hypothetical protein